MSRFRPAEPGDVDAIVAMMGGYYAQDGYTFVEDEARAAALTLIYDRALGRALGFSFEYRGREAFVDELFIAETHRGRGLGAEALALAEAWCREAGVNALHRALPAPGIRRLRPLSHDEVAHAVQTSAALVPHSKPGIAPRVVGSVEAPAFDRLAA